MNTRSIDNLLIDVYACPSNHSRWPRMLDRICLATGARSAVIQLLVGDGERIWSRRTLRDSASEAARSEHERYMGDDVNPRLRVALAFVPDASQCVFRDHDFFAPHDPALKELRDRLAAIQLGHFMSVGTPLSGKVQLALVLHRDLRDRREFDADEESVALRLAPHLCQAIQLAERIDDTEQRATELESALDRVRCALVLCDSAARVFWANSAAEKIFARGDRIRVNSDGLITTSSRETLALRRQIASVAQADRQMPLPERYVALGRSSAGGLLQVMMHPVSADSTAGRGSGQRRVLLALSSPGDPASLPADLIAQVFALSPAESRIAAALCSGLTINEYASASGVTVGTARFQLKQVLAKTQANRQADLVRQICSSVIAQALPASVSE